MSDHEDLVQKASNNVDLGSFSIVDRVDASTTRAQALQAAVDASRPASEMLVLEIDFCDVVYLLRITCTLG